MSRISSILLLIALLIPMGLGAYTNKPASQKEAEVAMRLIGHQLLWKAGDSTSLVLPVSRVGNAYKLSFQNDFSFYPDDLIAICDTVIQEAGLATDYIVEVEACSSGEIVHAFQRSFEPGKDLLACRGRQLPEGCYQVFITLNASHPIRNENLQIEDGEQTPEKESDNNKDNLSWLWLIIILPIAGWTFLKRKKEEIQIPEGEQVGIFVFNANKMTLAHNGQVTELTNKEAELLQLLKENANTTLTREQILEAVWQDEGDYVGRTLDVFISKLRKKLEADPSIEIVNVRGVGYRFILEMESMG
jgi:hypothetical protein